jgi:outer membrane protein
MLKSFLLILIIILLPFKSNAQQSIAYIDLNFIAKNSLIGKSTVTHIEKKKNAILEELKKAEKELKQKETAIISQKNVLDKDQYENKVNDLRKMINEYQKTKQEKNNELIIFTQKINKEIISQISPIVSEYSKEKSISLILQKKNIVTGRKDLDITADILILLDKKIKKINLN